MVVLDMSDDVGRMRLSSETYIFVCRERGTNKQIILQTRVSCGDQLTNRSWLHFLVI